MKAAFSLFDKNGDGKISAAELKQAFAELGQAPTDEEIRLMVFFYRLIRIISDVGKNIFS